MTVDAQAAREQAQALREEVRRQRLDYDGTADLEVVETAADMLDALSARLEAAETERDKAQREADWQMGAKLEAQMALKTITEALDLRFDELGNGWREATPKILARIETIVDEADRAFRERDAALGDKE